MQRPMIGHRCGSKGAAAGRHRSVRSRAVRTSRPCSWAPRRPRLHGDGGGGWVRRRALSLVNGSFSERFANLVRGLRQGVRPARRGRSAAPSSRHLRDTAAAADAGRRGDPGALGDSTGVLQDVEASLECGARLRRRAAAGGTRSPRSRLSRGDGSLGRGLDFVLTGSQKALALPRGWRLARLDGWLERARTLPARGLYFDLVSFLKPRPSISRPTRPRYRCCSPSRPSSGGIDARAAPKGAGAGTMRCDAAWKSGASSTASPTCGERPS